VATKQGTLAMPWVPEASFGNGQNYLRQQPPVASAVVSGDVAYDKPKEWHKCLGIAADTGVR
jgi:hypothetical protein